MKLAAEDVLVLPPGTYGAYLFDLDGTIADSMPLHFRAWSQAVKEGGGEFPEALFYAWGGIPLRRTVEMLNQHFGTSLDPDETVRRKEALYLGMLPALKPVASVVEVIKSQYGHIPYAIVSGSPCDSILKTLSTLGLLRYFPVLVGSEDYAKGKPDPEPFLTAAARLGVAAKDCLVFEDADAGIASAEAAGMRWVRVPVRYLEAATHRAAG